MISLSYKMRIRKRKKEIDLSEIFVRCECSYNNRKDRLERFGTCLRCGRVLNERAYFKRVLSRKLGKRIRGTHYED